jgi:integrating conjugative element protein (TIGR03757 family)
VDITKTFFVISATLTAVFCEFGWASDGPHSIEVFTDSTFREIADKGNVTVYVIDRIDQLQKALSKDLSTDPEKAKQEALHRFQTMDARLSQQLENAANGLVKAKHYGIDRYPAIVFDGEAAVYGVTDINAATQLYHQWQAEGSR